MNSPRQPRLGLDIGRVLISPGTGPNDTSFFGPELEAALATPPYPGMLDVVPTLVDRFGGRVWLVSKAGPRIERRTRQWLEFHRFHDRTGIPEEHVRFCRERPAKAAICQELYLSHFVDDRLDVLEHMRGIVPHLYLFGPQEADRAGTPWVTRIETWHEAPDRMRVDVDQ